MYIYIYIHIYKENMQMSAFLAALVPPDLLPSRATAWGIATCAYVRNRQARPSKRCEASSRGQANRT